MSAFKSLKPVTSLGMFALLLSVSSASIATTANAAPRKKGMPGRGTANPCAVAYNAALVREAAGRFREAQILLLSCAKATCGAAMVEQCSALEGQMTSKTPTFVPIVTDGTGVSRTDVEVRIDANVVASRVDGTPIAVDPGVHAITFTMDSGLPGEQKFALVATMKVTIDPGDRARPLPLSMPSASKDALLGLSQGAPMLDTADVAVPKPVAQVESHSHEHEHEIEQVKEGRSVLPYVIGGTGLLAITAGVLLTYWGRKDNAQLSQCAPNCSQASVDHIHTMYVVSDVSLGAGVLAVGVASILFATTSSRDTKARAHAPYMIDVAATPAGALTSVSGSF